MTNRILTNGKTEAEMPNFADTESGTGQQKAYVVLTEAERQKGFVRPVRRTYTHKVCGTDTTMGQAIAETYARDPKFYGATFCVHCQNHFPVSEFKWKGEDAELGS